MSLMDKLKSMFSGGSSDTADAHAGHDHDHAGHDHRTAGGTAAYSGRHGGGAHGGADGRPADSRRTSLSSARRS